MDLDVLCPSLGDTPTPAKPAIDLALIYVFILKACISD
jgi:hypothetical protein